MHASHRISTVVAVACAFITAATAQAQGDAPEISATGITAGVYLLAGGRGANSTLLVTDGGALLIDSKLDELNGQALMSTVGGLTDQAVRFLVNSHVHPDHTGGNAVLGRRGAVIVAHRDVRSILAAGQRGGPPAPAEALPVVTFGDNEGIELHVGDEIVRVRHMPAAHTTDNSMIHLVNANVFHLGDLYSPSRYPVLAGGTLQGFIDAGRQVLEIADADSRIVPGVGDVTGIDELSRFLDMLITVQRRVRTMVGDGKSLDEVIAAQPTAEFDATYGAPDHPLFLPVVYQQLGGQP